MTFLNVLIGIVVLVLIVWRQMRVRPVAGGRQGRVLVILGVIGVVQVISAAQAHPAPVLGWTALVVGLAVGAAVGVVRARTMRIWSSGGRLVRQGTAATLVWWAVGIAAHIGLDLLVRAAAPSAEPVNSASILLFVAVSLGAQTLVQMSRARELATL